MKRILMHLSFWVVYFVQSALLIFFVNLTRLQEPTLDGLFLAAANCLVILLPKLFFTYFILYVSLAKIAGGSHQRQAIISSILVLLCTLFLYRALVVFVVNPFIYHWNDGHTVFYPLGLLVALMDVGFVGCCCRD